MEGIAALLTNTKTEMSEHVARLERDLEGVREFSRNPVSGELSQSSGIKLIHNYFILRGLRYGIWAIPFLLFYLYFGIRVLWGCFRSWRTDVTQVGFVV